MLSKLNCESDPIYVQCTPEYGAELNECFPLVQEKVKKHCGGIIFGWQIWKTRLLVEAEFHAIWESQSGELLDIAPKPITPNKILFVPDRKRIYEGKQVDNVRINILGNRLVDDFIEVCEASFRLQNKGDRALKHELTLEGEDARAYNIFERAKSMLQVMIAQGLNHQSSCPCNSGNKYKVCHGKQIKALAKDI